MLYLIISFSPEKHSILNILLAPSLISTARNKVKKKQKKFFGFGIFFLPILNSQKNNLGSYVDTIRQMLIIPTFFFQKWEKYMRAGV